MKNSPENDRILSFSGVFLFRGREEKDDDKICILNYTVSREKTGACMQGKASGTYLRPNRLAIRKGSTGSAAMTAAGSARFLVEVDHVWQQYV